MGAALGLQASQAKNRMAGSEGFMDWLRGRHEAYTDAWHNAVVGIGNRGQMLMDDQLPRQQVGPLVAKRIIEDPTLTAESELGQALRARLEARGFDPIGVAVAEHKIFNGDMDFERIARTVHKTAAESPPSTNEDIMRLYEAAQNAGPRRVKLGDPDTTGAAVVDVLAGPQAAYLVPLTGAGLALLGGYTATRPDEGERVAQPGEVRTAR